MKHFVLSLFVFCMACNTKKAAEPPPATDTTTALPEAKVYNVNASAGGNEETVLGSITMGSYIFKVHEVIPYKPSDMQAKLMRLDDRTKDYYILDCSVENTTDNALDTGRDMLSTYFSLSNGTTVKYSLRGTGHLASYHTDYTQKYPQQQYDLIWGNKFPARGKSRCHLFGVEVPEGVTIAGIGFYQKNPAKHKFTTITP